MSTICSRADALRYGASVLASAGIERPRLEARLLLAHALGIGQEALLEDRVAPVAMDRYTPLLARRAAREPLALITGRREFWSLSFCVSPATLIPRADTETLLEAALALFPDRAAVASVLDLGTGTGCLLLAALTEFPAAFGVGVDLSPAAARLAANNAACLGLGDRAAFAVGDWTASLAGRFDLILCNPPYIQTGTIPTLMPEVARHEPVGALDGGPDGLDAYRRLLPTIPGRLNPGGAAVVEIGAGQAPAVGRMARDAGLTNAGLRGEAFPDLTGTPRALVLRNARC